MALNFESTTTLPFVGDALFSTVLPDTFQHFQAHFLWALIVGFHLSFMFAFVMGANEVSNAFATSVGSGVIRLRTAYILASIVETAGAVLLGYNILETVRFKVIDLEMYTNKPNELLIGQVAILGGSALWMGTATVASLPVSSTHSHIGSIIGASLVLRGFVGLHMDNVYKIVASWIISPVLSGIVSALLYIIIDITILRRKDSLKAGFRALPFIYLFVFAFNTFMVVHKGSKWLGLNKTPLSLSISISVGVGILATLIFQFIVRPYIVRWVNKANKTPDMMMGMQAPPPRSASSVAAAQQPALCFRDSSTAYSAPRKFLNWLLPSTRNGNRIPRPTLRLFSAIQVFSGCFTGFSHGSKDIPNTIAPLATLLFIYTSGIVPSVGQPNTMETPLWILFYGSLAACAGFCIFGHRVIKTVGKKFTEIDPPCGFCVEMGAAITVMIASKSKIPISMTLCIVGSIVSVGAVRGTYSSSNGCPSNGQAPNRQHESSPSPSSNGPPVNWTLFRNAIFTWVLTFPISGLFSAAITFALKNAFL